MSNTRISPFRLSDITQMDSLVEHRSRFNLAHCELNIFETRQQAKGYPLAFEGFTVTSMLRGKKIMHLDGYPDFEYVPGETVLAPHGSKMVIDFPEAELEKPTQCTALVIDTGYLKNKIDEINEKKYGPDSIQEWNLDPEEIFLQNDQKLAKVSTRLLQTFTDDDPFKDLYADLILQELLLCILRLQHQKSMRTGAESNPNADPFAAVVHFVRQNISADLKVDELCRIARMSKSRFYRKFVNYAGITPLQLILDERIRYAKQMLTRSDLSVKEITFDAGFNDPNYFCRIFKKMEGVTPGTYRKHHAGLPGKTVVRLPDPTVNEQPNK